ncbi:MAG: L-lactate permease, partial [Rubripirellula sp.]
ALFAALAMTIPYVVISHPLVLGPEFPSLLGALIGLAIVIPAARSGFLISDQAPWEFPKSSQWESSWVGKYEIQLEVPPQWMTLGRAWVPYLVIAALLVLTRLPGFSLGPWVKSFKFPSEQASWENLLGTSVTVPSVEILYLPGTVFILASLLAIPLHQMRWQAVQRSFLCSTKMVTKASVALLFSVPMVQVFIHSGGGATGLSTMPDVLAGVVAEAAGSAWPVFASFVGGIGAFIAGSNTISNMMFSQFQFTVAQQIGADPLWVVALQAVGGAAGNVICVHNVVSACAVVGFIGREGEVIRLTLLMFIFYVLMAAFLGLLIV